MPMKTPEEQKEYQKLWMRKRRAEWLKSQGDECALCKSTDRLEVDHVDKTLKTIKASVLWSRNDEVRKKELENCQVLCYSCHKLKTRNENLKNLQHGDYGMYKVRGCRCDLCRAENANRVRIQRANKRAKDENND